MISDLWTIEPEGDSESAATLAALGVLSASLTRPSQAPAVLSLSFGSAPAWSWESQWVLRRDGVIAFRGRVATPPSTSLDAGVEGASLELRDAWWDLERTPYTQSWRHVTAAGAADIRTGHARIGVDPSTGQRQTTIEALALISTAATEGGSPITISQVGLATITPPPIDAANRSVADILRAVLRWHPSAVARVVSGESGDTVVITDRSAAEGNTLSVPGPEVEAIDITPRPDLVVDEVFVYYEAEVSQPIEDSAEEGETALIRSRQRLAVHLDNYPGSGGMTRQTLVVTLPAPTVDSQQVAPPTPHSIPVVTRPIPETGASGTSAEKWWLDQLRLADAGLTTDDIKLPTATVGETQAHRVRFAWAADEDPLNDPTRPDPINPNSTALWRPPNVADLPRELVSGNLAEWMRVKAADLVVDATVAVRRSTVDALPLRDRRTVLAHNPREGTVQGVAAYLIDASVKVTGTDAKTKLYTNWPATGQDSETAGADAVAASAAEVVIPDLARRMWEERQRLTYEGSVTLSEAEAGARSWIGSRLSLSVSDHTEWADMDAMIQRESLDLVQGSTRLDIETPKHLTERDWAALHETARQARQATVNSAVTPAPVPSEEPEDPTTGQGGVFLPSVAPANRPPIVYGQPGGSTECTGFIISVDADTGLITATGSGVTYSGSFDAGYSEPTWVQGGNPLTTGGGNVGATGTFFVWVKITYASTSSSTFGTAWEITDVEFDWGASQPSDTVPTFDFSTDSWSGSGVKYAPWGKVVDRVVEWTYGGGIIVKICGPEEIIIQHGCQA